MSTHGTLLLSLPSSFDFFIRFFTLLLADLFFIFLPSSSTSLPFSLSRQLSLYVFSKKRRQRTCCLLLAFSHYLSLASCEGHYKQDTERASYRSKSSMILLFVRFGNTNTIKCVLVFGHREKVILLCWFCSSCSSIYN